MDGLVAAYKYVILRRLLTHRLSPEMARQAQAEMQECRDAIRVLVRERNDVAMMRRNEIESRPRRSRGEVPWLQAFIVIAILAIGGPVCYGQFWVRPPVAADIVVGRTLLWHTPWRGDGRCRMTVTAIYEDDRVMLDGWFGGHAEVTKGELVDGHFRWGMMEWTVRR